MALSLPNELFRFGFAPLGPLALVPLYIALLDAPGLRGAALLVSLFGAAQHALSSYWLYFFKDFAFWTIGGTTLAYAVVYYVLGLYLGLFVQRSGRPRPLAFALLWAAFEYQKSVGFLGYPWGLLPYSLTDALPLLQVADLTGVYGLSAALALTNAAIAELLAQPRAAATLSAKAAVQGLRRALGPERMDARSKAGWLGLAMAFAALVAGYGAWRLSTPIPEAGHFEALIVQQNIDPWYAGEEAALAANVRLARQALAKAPRAPDLVVFSETSLRRPYAEFRDYFSTKPEGYALIPFIKDSGAPLLTGAPVVLDWETWAASNSVLLIGPDASLRGSYAKIHPVPFAEAIPLWEFAWFRTFMREAVGLESGWVMGTEYKVFDLQTRAGEIRFGTPICFEDAFPEVCSRFFEGGADLLVNLTNDSWSKTVSAEIQHWAAARFRSIEYRRTLLRSTNGGLSCVVGPYGELQASLPLFEPAARIVDVPIYRSAGNTVYFRFGDWFALSCLLLSGLWAVILMAGEGFLSPAPKRRKP